MKSNADQSNEWLERIRLNKHPEVLNLISELRAKGLLEEGLLSNVNLSELNLREVNFEKANLTGSDFHHSDIRDANFDNAQMQGCHLWAVDAHNATFISTDLRNANLTMCRMFFASFEKANLSKADLTYAGIDHSSFKFAKFEDAILHNIYLLVVDCSSSVFTGASFSGASMVHCNFEHAELNWQQLFSAKELHGSVMPAGKIHDGRLNLPGDIEWLRNDMGISLDEVEKIAEAYGVTLQDYRIGQQWWHENDPTGAANRNGG